MWGNQSGAALVIALVMIVVLTLIALATTLSSNFENMLAGNKRGSTDCFYTADSGIQASLSNISNFSPALYVTPASLSDHPEVDSRFKPPMSIGNLSTQPDVYIYHTTLTGSPRGLHMSAAGNYAFSYFIIDSKGCDQLDVSLVKFNCEHQEEVVRLLPTSQGGT